jgi:hypothetical protein
MDGSVPIGRTEEDDRRVYPALRTAVLVLAIADTPSNDFGFQARLTTMAQDILTFEANGQPLSAVARLLAKIFLHSQRRRAMDMYGDASADHADEMLSYSDSEAIMSARARMLRETRETLADEQARFIHMMSRMQQTPMPRGQRQQRAPAATPPKMKTPILQLANGVTPPAASPYGRNDDTGDGSWKKINHAKWRAAYGKKTVNGVAHTLCFFHANRPGGCSKAPADCGFTHEFYPDEYHNRAFEAVGPAAQQVILQKTG